MVLKIQNNTWWKPVVWVYSVINVLIFVLYASGQSLAGEGVRKVKIGAVWHAEIRNLLSKDRFTIIR